VIMSAYTCVSIIFLTELVFVSHNSGGWKMRIGIAKLLLQDPNIVLLDEPTNHLDLDSVSWLEKFLVKQNIPLVVVSHDREFLDKVCQLAV
jgi:ATP-binding cassette, subfamily F, member 3